MEQEFEADKIEISDIDGGVGLDFSESDSSGQLVHYFRLSRSADGPRLCAEFNEQCNACENRIELVKSGAGQVAVRFTPDSRMRAGNTDQPFGDPLTELRIRFTTVMGSADLSSLLRYMSAGVCRHEELA